MYEYMACRSPKISELPSEQLGGVSPRRAASSCVVLVVTPGAVRLATAQRCRTGRARPRVAAGGRRRLPGAAAAAAALSAHAELRRDESA